MTKRLYADSSRVVIYEEAPGGGDPVDPNSLMNRPIVAPMSWLSNVYFHSDFDYYNTFIATTATVNHAAVAGATFSPTSQITVDVKSSADYLIATHNLGYIPKFYVALGGKMIPNVYPIQLADPAFRYVCIYATTTQIRAYETTQVFTSGLSSLSINYQVLIFADSEFDAGLPFLNIEPGSVIFGQGKFRMDRPPMRVSATGETPFAQALNRTTAIRNGSIRVYLPDGSFVDAGPFNGTLPAPSFVNVQSGLF